MYRSNIMNRDIITKLIQLANSLDKRGMQKESNTIDLILKQAGGSGGGWSQQNSSAFDACKQYLESISYNLDRDNMDEALADAKKLEGRAEYLRQQIQSTMPDKNSPDMFDAGTRLREQQKRK